MDKKPNHKFVVTVPEDIKNADGRHGLVCTPCVGYGFTYSMVDGSKLPCNACRETGIYIDVHDLQKQVVELTRLVKMLYSELKAKGKTNIE